MPAHVDTEGMDCGTKASLRCLNMIVDLLFWNSVCRCFYAPIVIILCFVLQRAECQTVIPPKSSKDVNYRRRFSLCRRDLRRASMCTEIIARSRPALTL